MFHLINIVKVIKKYLRATKMIFLYFISRYFNRPCLFLCLFALTNEDNYEVHVKILIKETRLYSSVLRRAKFAWENFLIDTLFHNFTDCSKSLFLSHIITHTFVIRYN